MNERRHKFKKLAEGRTNSALVMIRKLRKLNNTKSYDFTQKDVEKIAKALEDEVAAFRKHFATRQQKKVFRLVEAVEETSSNLQQAAL